MAVDEQTGLLYSTHPAKRIDLFAPDGIREGVSPKRTGQLAYKNVPYDLDFYEGRLFVSSNGTEKFCEVNPRTGEIMKDHTTIGGITLQAPEILHPPPHAVHHRPREKRDMRLRHPHE